LTLELWFLAFLVFSASGSAAEPTPAQAQFFENKIRPILANNCYKCHSQQAEKVKAGLLLDTKEGVLKGGETGPAIEPGDPEKSLLIKAVRYTDPDLQMPPKGKKLAEAEVADLVAWVKMGAPDPRIATAAQKAWADSSKKHWAWQPISRPAIPEVKDSSWPKTPVDNFILAKLEEKDLKPNPPADKRTLIRRATFDLIGLPPTPQEVDDFVKDDSPDAFAKVVDRLLASPHYGERWGRHWLDVARYSDTKGQVPRQREDPNYPFAWSYRDYVIRSFNEDKPYNVFIIEQIAADKLPATARNPGNLAALGFLTLGDRFMGMQNDIINDRIDVVTKGFLGLTVSCARCHDHKFDPIPTKDYYSLHGIFASSAEPPFEPVISKITPGEEYSDYYKKRMDLDREKGVIEPKFREARRAKDREAVKRLQREARQNQSAVARLELTHPGAPARAMVLEDAAKPHDSPVFIRGEAGNKGPTVPRRFLEVLSGPLRPAFTNGSGRLQLAQATASKNNPATPRVMLNRIWLHHFGEGFVPTPDDLGTMSEPPSHPELVDYLAAYFMESGWSLKKVHRLIMLSSVYQESSAGNPRYAQVDPNNRLLWRANVHRLAIFLAFLYLLSRMKDIRRTFEYHGAEHKVVFNYESGQPVTVENAQKFVTFHPRCGTSFLIVVMLVALLVYSVLPFDGFLAKFLARIALLPLIAGMSYELIRFAAKYRKGLMATLTTPGLWLQRVTTKPPSDDQTAIAIRALDGAFELEKAQGGELVIA